MVGHPVVRDVDAPANPDPIVLEHVIGIEGADEKIAELLGTKRVTFQ